MKLVSAVIKPFKLDEVKASSRQNPFIRFEQDKKLFRNALEVEALAKGFENGPLFKNFNLLLEVGEKIAILGANGVGKTTMLKALVGELEVAMREAAVSRRVRDAAVARVRQQRGVGRLRALDEVRGAGQ